MLSRWSNLQNRLSDRIHPPGVDTARERARPAETLTEGNYARQDSFKSRDYIEPAWAPTIETTPEWLREHRQHRADPIGPPAPVTVKPPELIAAYKMTRRIPPPPLPPVKTRLRP